MVLSAVSGGVAEAASSPISLQDGLVLLDTCLDTQGGKGGVSGWLTLHSGPMNLCWDNVLPAVGRFWRWQNDHDAKQGIKHCKHTHRSSHICLQDVRDALLGRLFGLAALVRGGLVRDAASASNVITALLSLANKKTFLMEAAVSVVLELLLHGPESGSGTAGQVPPQAAAQVAQKKRKAGDVEQGEGAVAKGGARQRWLSDGVLRQLLADATAGGGGGGGSNCEPLRAFVTASPETASAEVRVFYQPGHYTRHVGPPQARMNVQDRRSPHIMRLVFLCSNPIAAIGT
jgi:hypothetical protein